MSSIPPRARCSSAPLGPPRSARFPGFSRVSPAARRARLVESGWLSSVDEAGLAQGGGLEELTADAMIENVIGLHTLPLAVALNFVVNGVERLVPMAVEEPSIVAACSYGARLAASSGGFVATADPPLMAAQVHLHGVPDLARATAAVLSHADELLAFADSFIPRMRARGGGARELEVRVLAPDVLCVHVLVDCRDAMGANLVNTVAEGVAPRLAELTAGRVVLRILSNLTDRRTVTVRARVPVEALASAAFPDGAAVRDRIVEAQRCAELDLHRAATHNKGIMNGVDAALLAMGNDWRAVEAGAHAFAARDGRYRPLSSWRAGDDGSLEGTLTLPLAASTVGGAARAQPGVARALRLARVTDAGDLAMLAAAAGLASNLAALKALVTEGIQRGHMALHARRIACEAGAEGELIELVAAQLSAEQAFRPERAGELLQELRRRGPSSPFQSLAGEQP